MINLARLEKLADAAASNPWGQEGRWHATSGESMTPTIEDFERGRVWAGDPRGISTGVAIVSREEYGALIAACSPEVVKALIRCIRELTGTQVPYPETAAWIKEKFGITLDVTPEDAGSGTP